MSKRAEQAALREYPPSYSEANRNAKRIQSYKVDTHEPIRQIYIKGYSQAEKDVALTWIDIRTIHSIFIGVCLNYENDGIDFYSQEFYEEVLRRFNEQKNKNG